MGAVRNKERMRGTELREEREAQEEAGRDFWPAECLPGCLVLVGRARCFGFLLSFGGILQFSGPPTAGGVVRDPGGIGRDPGGTVRDLLLPLLSRPLGSSKARPSCFA